jgi:hypothetical protein
MTRGKRNAAIRAFLLSAVMLLLASCGGGGTADESIDDEQDEQEEAGTGTGAADAGSSPGDRYALLAWNDLGMHCMDGNDYSVFSILPPFNTLNAQLVRNGKLVTDGVTLTYEATPDLAGSLNTTSIGKTNFWDYSAVLYGADVPPDTGITGTKMASLTPEPMTFNTQHQWFEAEGIPITPVDDDGNTNHYPMARVVARNLSGEQLASARVVLPVSDEMSCISCHASTNSLLAIDNAAQPDAGWAQDPDPELDWKKNILLLHDETQAGLTLYLDALAANGYDEAGLLATVDNGTPVLCAACHGSNALPGTGYDPVPPLTQAMHASHASVLDPATGVQLNDDENRTACYLCHPGSRTQCLRGAMGNAKDDKGDATMSCQSCHGNMAQVGDAGRVGWLDQPNCQACHHDGQRELVGVDVNGIPLDWGDPRWATNPDTPEPGFSLFRFSTGHGELQCESCHGSTHAIFPSANDNDNVLSEELQGHKGTVAECDVCHTSVPRTADGGPHGMHAVSQWWVDEHGDHVESTGKQQCTACHGADYRGSPISKVTEPRIFDIESGQISYAAGQEADCYDCHDGPDDD